MRINAVKKRRKSGYHFSIHGLNEEQLLGVNTAIRYPYASQCRVHGSLRFAQAVNGSVLFQYLSKLIQSHNGKQQSRWHEEGVGTGGYYIIHDNNCRTKSKRTVIAVVRPLSADRLVVAIFNENYHTETMDFFFCDKQKTL
jgi:hypothetical protein